MFCPNCGTEVSASAKFCPECGKPLSSAPKASADAPKAAEPKADEPAAAPAKREIRIYGYTEWYLFTPGVDAYLNGRYVGKVPYNGFILVEVPNEDVVFQFEWKALINRKCNCILPKSFNGSIHLQTDRVSGGISAHCY
ncbi:MAG: zinc-ribbon domain-containing protein [Paludibacteraceae bacterium]|nr:zinc-ribbon domain-containing protein [Paludibacteraceae bacterium]